MWYRRSADTTKRLKEHSQYGAKSHVIVKHLKRSQNIDAQDGSLICNNAADGNFISMKNVFTI